jgi:hypothetical protein
MPHITASRRFYITEGGDARVELSGKFVAAAARMLAPIVAEVSRLAELRARAGFPGGLGKVHRA